MNILLIGGAGFLGLNIAIALRDVGYRVHISDIKSESVLSTDLLLKNCSLYRIDGSNFQDVVQHINNYDIDCIIDLASNLIPSSSYSQYLHDLNFSMNTRLNLLGELASRGIKYIFFSSGGAIYGNSNQHLLDEASPKNPISYYGLYKLHVEECISFFGRTRGLNYLIIRPSNPFGPYQDPAKNQGLIAVAIDKMKKNQPIEIWGDGSCVRDFIWVTDLAKAIVKLIEKDHWKETYNLGSGVGFSINHVLKIIQTFISNNSQIIYSPSRSVDVKHVVLNINKIKSDIPFHPTRLEQGILMYLERLKND